MKYPAFLQFRNWTPAKKWATSPVYLPVIVEVLAVALIAWLAARLFLLIISPVDSGNESVGAVFNNPAQTALGTAESYDVLRGYDPFNASIVTEKQTDPDYIEAVETNLNISVEGMLMLESGLGSAIIRTTGGTAQTFVVGDEIENGVILERLEPGRAIISRNGVLESVSVESSSQSGPVTKSPPSAMRPAAARATQKGLDIERLAEIFTLRPVRNANGRATGTYTVMAGRDTTAFEATGLIDGDVIKKVNNVIAPQDPERLFDMFETLQIQDRAVLLVDRGGEEVEIPISISELE